MCYYRENKPPCYCSYRELMFTCSNAARTSLGGTLQPCGKIMAMPSSGLRTCTKCESEVPLIENHPNNPWEFDIEAYLFDNTNPEAWRQVDEIIRSQQLDWQFPPAFAESRVSFVPRKSSLEAGPSRLPAAGPHAPSQFPTGNTPIPVSISDSVPNSLVNDFPSNFPSSQPIGTDTTPLQLQGQLPHPAAPPVNEAVRTQNPSGIKRPASPPLPSVQPQKRQKQQPQNDTPRVGILLPPNAPPVNRMALNPQVSGVKRPAPVLPGNTQPQKRQKNQHQNTIPIAEPLRRNAILAENRAKAYAPREAIQQREQTPTAAVPLPSSTYNIPTTTAGSGAPINHPPNHNIPYPRHNPNVSNTTTEREEQLRYKAAKKEEQLRRKALLAKNRAEAYPQLEPPQRGAATPTAAESSQPPTTLNHTPNANSPLPAQNPQVSKTRIQPPSTSTLAQTTIPIPRTNPLPPTSHHPATSQTQQNPIIPPPTAPPSTQQFTHNPPPIPDLPPQNPSLQSYTTPATTTATSTSAPHFVRIMADGSITNIGRYTLSPPRRGSD